MNIMDVLYKKGVIYCMHAPESSMHFPCVDVNYSACCAHVDLISI